jgi:hypothetical protein
MPTQKILNKGLVKKTAYISSRIEGYPTRVSFSIHTKAKKLINGHK